MLKKLTKNPAVVSAVVAGIIRGIGATLRIEIKDEAGFSKSLPTSL